MCVCCFTYLNDLIVEVFGVICILHKEDKLFFALSVFVQLHHAVMVQLRMHYAFLVGKVFA